MRLLPEGKSYKNESIDTTLSNQNTTLISRGKTVAEVTKYRKKIEKTLFKYNRKNLVHAVEVVIQLPKDCPPEQEEDFFKETLNFFIDFFKLPIDFFIDVTVHRDEKFYDNEGNLISKNHMHILFIPAVKDNKHSDFEYKLCADALTKKSILFKLHPSLQSYLNKKSIHATVHKNSSGSEKKISLSVNQMKAITQATGKTFDKALTMENLIEIIKENEMAKKILEKEKSKEKRTGWRSDRTNSFDRSDRSERN